MILDGKVVATDIKRRLKKRNRGSACRRQALAPFGGVGPMTVAELMSNTVESWRKRV